MKRILSALLLVLMLACVLSGCGNVARPEIKKGEFDFSVTYELNGEVKTVSGVYVCKFDGVDLSLDGGFHREWKGYIKDDAMEDSILLTIAENGGEVELNLGLDPDCFMGDPNVEGDEPFVPWISVKVVNDEGLYFENDTDVIANTYGAKIISYDYDEPIQNTFK